MATLSHTVRELAMTNPDLRQAIRIRDTLCYIFKSIVDSIIFVIVSIIKFTYKIVEKLCSILIRYLRLIPYFGSTRHIDYKRIEKRRKRGHREPIPYENELFKRTFTYQGGLVLGTLLYLFVYFVLIKRHTYISIAVAFLLLIVYLIILENSHNIRSILMLCLPIMFTNRGRAMVFCYMLAIMVSGPLRNCRLNINQLQMSIHCCKQYLIVKTDKVVDDNVVQNIVRAEEIAYKLIDDIKEFAKEIMERSRVLIELAITVDEYIEQSFKKLLDIVDLCNAHTQEVYNNCVDTFKYAYIDCKDKLGSGFDILCEIVEPLQGLCNVVHLPDILCTVPRELVRYVDRTMGERLRHHIRTIEQDLYVDVEIDHYYSYNATKSKSYRQVRKEIQADLARIFFYFQLVTTVFNLLSLILVIWIIITATLYHMHYLEDMKYDNLYLDGYLREIDDMRKRKSITRQPRANDLDSNTTDSRQEDVDDETLLLQDSQSLEDDNLNNEPLSTESQFDESTFLFPMTALHKQKYYEPFSIWMNDTEIFKVYVAGWIWWWIVQIIFFVVLADFALYQLIELLDNTLNTILFSDDLPLVDITSKGGDQSVIKYNRTYLNQMRIQAHQEWKIKRSNSSHRTGSLSGMYRRLMDSIEEKIPDDIAILDSLHQCLPIASEPKYDNYKTLLYLAIVTFAGVILEAYALRTRHCIANLYYPQRARKRAVWFYKKLLAEKPRFDGTEPLEPDEKDKWKHELVRAGWKAYEEHAKRQNQKWTK